MIFEERIEIFVSMLANLRGEINQREIYFRSNCSLLFDIIGGKVNALDKLRLLFLILPRSNFTITSGENILCETSFTLLDR